MYMYTRICTYVYSICVCVCFSTGMYTHVLEKDMGGDGSCVFLTLKAQIMWKIYAKSHCLTLRCATR